MNSTKNKPVWQEVWQDEPVMIRTGILGVIDDNIVVPEKNKPVWQEVWGDEPVMIRTGILGVIDDNIVVPEVYLIILAQVRDELRKIGI